MYVTNAVVIVWTWPVLTNSDPYRTTSTASEQFALVHECWYTFQTHFDKCYIYIFQCPYICHLLYLLTRKESGKLPHISFFKLWPYNVFSTIAALLTFGVVIAVRVFRVRKLLELQSKLVNLHLVWCFETCLSRLYLFLILWKFFFYMSYTLIFKLLA